MGGKCQGTPDGSDNTNDLMGCEYFGAGLVSVDADRGGVEIGGVEQSSARGITLAGVVSVREMAHHDFRRAESNVSPSENGVEEEWLFRWREQMLLSVMRWVWMRGGSVSESGSSFIW